MTGPAAEEGAGVRVAGSGLVSAKFMGTFSIANVWGGPKVTECKAWCGIAGLVTNSILFC